jgi:predicted ATPase
MIHKIRIQNFKSLRDVTVDLSPVTVFIGKSGTGKTNFASAIRFLRDYLAGQHGQLLQEEAARKCATNPSGLTEFEIEFGVPEFPDHFSYSLAFSEHVSHLPQAESLRYGGRTIFEQGEPKQKAAAGFAERRWEVRPKLVSVPDAGPLALGRLPGIEEAVIAHTALTAALGVYSFPLDPLSGIAPQQQQGPSGLGDHGENYLGTIKDIARDLHKGVAVRKAIVATLRQINETVASVELDSLQNPQKAIVGHRLGEKTLELNLRQESDGFRRFYAHLLALYQMPPKQTSVFEEPENGIYPAALELLADEFKAAPEDHRGQVLLTTHSPALLDCFSADQIRVFELVDLETKIGPLAEEQKEALKEKLLHAGELLTVDPARRQES